MAKSAKQFVMDSYRIISASSPTVPLHGSDMLEGIRFLNELLQFYSSSALLLTVAKQVEFVVSIGQQEITFGAPDHVPTPDVTEGRLANLLNAWLTLEGVTYPLIDESRNVFMASYKYDPQVGLPRFCIINNEANLTRMRIYPGASQLYTLNVYAKFELPYITQDTDMDLLPHYFLRYGQLALARDLAMYKGRLSAWDEKLEGFYSSAKKDMESTSAVNLVITSANESYLNGSWRVKAGI